MVNEIALIVGAGRGIGRASATLFHQKGMRVIAVSRTTEELIQTANGEMDYFTADISQEGEVRALFQYIKQNYGKLDILVNCAASFHKGLFEEDPLSVWDEQYRVNIRGIVHTCQEAFHLMKKVGGGSIVNVSSLSGIPHVKKFEGFSTYVVSKFALCGLTEALAVEGSPFNIRVNAIAPGAVNTEMLKKALPNITDYAEPEKIAEVIYFLASPALSGVMNGTIIPIFCGS